MSRVSLCGLIIVLAASACTNDEESGAVVTSTASSASTQPATTMTTLPQPTWDLEETPQVWFGLQPPLGANEFGEVRTGPEFYDLFRTEADWSSAAENIHLLHVFGEWAAWRSTLGELAAVVEDLNRRGIAIGIEGGPLVPREGCSDNIEGFAGPVR